MIIYNSSFIIPNLVRGQSLGETQRQMMQKIEELTLYMIEKEKQNAAKLSPKEKKKLKQEKKKKSSTKL